MGGEKSKVPLHMGEKMQEERGKHVERFGGRRELRDLRELGNGAPRRWRESWG